MPNQLIQKRKKDSKNLCLTCQKNRACQDYKVLKYVDICEDYRLINLCKSCNNYLSCQFRDSEKLSIKCFDYDRKIDGSRCPNCNTDAPYWIDDGYGNCKCKRCGFVYKHSQKELICPLCNGSMVLDDNGSDTSQYRCKYCGFKESDNSAISKIKTIPTINITVPIKSYNRTFRDELEFVKFTKGLKTFDSLKSEYDGILNLFVGYDGVNSSLIDIAKFKKVSSEIYDKGLKFITLALEIYKQLDNTNADNLKSETEELQVSFDTCKDVSSALHRTLKEAIDRNNKVISLIKKQHDRIDELFGQIYLCKDALMEIRLGLPELLHHQSTEDLNKVINESKDRLSFAQRLLEEYKVQGI